MKLRRILVMWSAYALYLSLKWLASTFQEENAENLAPVVNASPFDIEETHNK